MSDATHLIRREPASEQDEFAAPHSERKTDTMGDHEQTLLRLTSSHGAVWLGEVELIMDAELAVEVATALAIYARTRETQARAKRGGLTLGENYTCVRLQFLARQILDKLKG